MCELGVQVTTQQLVSTFLVMDERLLVDPGWDVVMNRVQLGCLVECMLDSRCIRIDRLVVRPWVAAVAKWKCCKTAGWP